MKELLFVGCHHSGIELRGQMYLHLYQPAWQVRNQSAGFSNSILINKPKEGLQRPDSEQDIIPYGLFRHDPFRLAVFGHKTHLKADRVRRIFNGPKFSINLYRSSFEWDNPKKGLSHFCTTGTLKPGNAEHFTLPKLKIDIFQEIVPAILYPQNNFTKIFRAAQGREIMVKIRPTINEQSLMCLCPLSLLFQPVRHL